MLSSLLTPTIDARVVRATVRARGSALGGCAAATPIRRRLRPRSRKTGERHTLLLHQVERSHFARAVGGLVHQGETGGIRARPQPFTWTNAGPPSCFFRAVEGSAITQPFLVMEDARNKSVTLRLNGLAGGLYVIESATNVGAPVSWVPVQQVALTNATKRFSVTNHGDPVRVFRAKVN